ncbi:choline transporter-like protein 2 [Tanacetum coccineum]|uniref:Choline transporter-like protein 2 n=1 Tax=Tanacetum coccineum TaxID=301880 RepID=A0ABQ4WDF8_9ASTR
MARSYLPSKVSEILTLWRKDLKKVNYVIFTICTLGAFVILSRVYEIKDGCLESFANKEHKEFEPQPFANVVGNIFIGLSSLEEMSGGEKYAKYVEDSIQFGTYGQVTGFIFEAIQVEQVVCNTSATMSVQGIFHNLKKLDFAKKQITIIITALHHLTMLGQSSVKRYVADVGKSWPVLIVCGGFLPIFLTLLWLLMVRHLVAIGYRNFLQRSHNICYSILLHERFPESGWLMLGLLSRVADAGFVGALADAGCLWYRNCWVVILLACNVFRMARVVILLACTVFGMERVVVLHKYNAPTGRPFRCVSDISKLRLQKHWYMLVLVTSGDAMSSQMISGDAKS